MTRTFRVAIAALIAALSVAAMIDAAPAKASVGPMTASLSIVSAGSSYQYVYVSAVVRTSYYEADMLARQGCRAEFRLWGDDPISDNLLFGPQLMSYGSPRPDGLYFEGFLWAPPGLLNEDWGGDEVYAGVRLVSLWNTGRCSISRSAQSNTVYGDF